MTGSTAPTLEAVLALERELQTPECRRDRARLDEILSDDFAEIGATGRVWHRDDLIEAISGKSNSSRAPLQMEDLKAQHITDDVVLVNWVSRRGLHTARRSSLWRLTDGRWRLVRHQGTPLP
ncbi:DUF4440 domain-containing protein [Gordonia iterans]|uniref:DUF4440 domain-containing protein n=1 Tax=Gordonia iterans TaxID=1004901 RepID=A0A2S0KI97_9ACTN|nr:DUF4440 domain-containing protein [Gordonia iterans]AVM01410.1 DUF4440 domain-containing protein [Gordonia iterans]